MTPPGDKLRTNNPSFAAALVRALNVKGDYPAHITPELSPSLETLSLRDPEYQILSGWRRFRSGFLQAAVAGQRGFAQLNTQQTDTLAVIEQITLSNPVAALSQFSVGLGGAVAAGASTTIMDPADDRISIQSRCVANIGTSAAPVIPTLAELYSVPGNSSLVIPGPWVITGILGLCIIHSVVNTVLNVNVAWKERRLTKPEVTTL